MDSRSRSSLAGGLVLIALGVVFLAAQLYPNIFGWLDPARNWPLIVIGVGFFLLIVGLLSGVPPMAVPACIVGGIGGILCWQNATGAWESWAYLWTLIPGFVGVGIILSGLLSGDVRQGINEGGRALVVSLVLFAVFASFLGRSQFAIPLWPILLIALGVVVLVRTLLGMR